MSHGARPFLERPAFRLTLLSLPASTFLQCQRCAILGVRPYRRRPKSRLARSSGRFECYTALWPLRQLRRLVSDDCFRSLLVTLIHSRLDYGNIVMVRMQAYCICRVPSNHPKKPRSAPKNATMYVTVSGLRL